MTAKTNQQLTEEMKIVRNQIEALQVTVNQLTQDVNARPKLSDLARSEEELSAQIRNNSTLINQLERQLATVVVPGDTRYYLTQQEVSDFRSNFAKLLATMADFERLYNNLVAYSANLPSS